jgi:hypothetical protein
MSVVLCGLCGSGRLKPTIGTHNDINPRKGGQQDYCSVLRSVMVMVCGGCGCSKQNLSSVMRNKPLPPVLKGGSSRPPGPQRTRNIVARARCRGPCITLRFKEDFAEKEWRNKEDPHCKACIQRLREQGKTHRCARCRVWSARSDLSAKEATTLALLLCKDCKKRSGLRKCSQPSH